MEDYFKNLSDKTTIFAAHAARVSDFTPCNSGRSNTQDGCRIDNTLHRVYVIDEVPQSGSLQVIDVFAQITGSDT